MFLSFDADDTKKLEDQNLRLRCARIFLGVAGQPLGVLAPADYELVRRLAGERPLADTLPSDFLTDLLKHWFATRFPSAGVLLAAMVAANPHDLPPPPPLSEVPDWLRSDWLGFLLRKPGLFRQVGERERYFEAYSAIVDCVYHAIVADPLPDVRALAERFRNEADPLAVYFTHQHPTRIFRRWAQVVEASALMLGMTLSHTFAPRHGERPRIGLMLNGLRKGPEAFYLLAHLSPALSARFDVTVYLLLPGLDGELVREVEATGARIAVIPEGSVNTRAAWIRGHDLDLMLFASNCAVRGEIALLSMCRLARRQLIGAASPVSPGFTNGDSYLLAEGNVEAAFARHCNEKLYRMPGVCTYYAFGLDRAPATVTIDRASLDIPADAPLLVTTANYYKITPELVRLWAHILWRVPDALLLLMPFNPNWSTSYQDNILTDLLRREMLARGVNPHRLRAVSRLPQRADVHRVIAMGDVYLDSHPFGGFCSMIDPLELAVPVVVRDAPTFHGRIAASMLRDIGLGDMVLATDDDYVDAAVHLATDASARTTARQRIRDAAAANQAFTRTDSYAERFVQVCDDLITDDRGQMRDRLADAARARRAATAVVDRLSAERSVWLQSLTDTKLIPLLILPYFRALGTAATGRVLLDVGACVGGFARPFLTDGDWQVHMLEPDASCFAAMTAVVDAFPGRAHHHALVAIDGSEDEITYHRTAIGLSGLGPSPYAETQQAIVLPATRLADLARKQNLAAVDLLKVDAEGFDFQVLNGYDFGGSPPRLVMVEFGDMYAGQSEDKIMAGIAAMAERGYDPLILSCDDDNNFRQGIWEYRVIAATFDRPRRSKAGTLLGNIIFFRKDDPLFPALFCRLVESFLPGAERDGAWAAAV